MNRIYRIVFNKKSGLMQVVSELAKSNHSGKNSTVVKGRARHKMLVLSAGIMLGLSQSAFAVDIVGTTGNSGDFLGTAVNGSAGTSGVNGIDGTIGAPTGTNGTDGGTGANGGDANGGQNGLDALIVNSTSTNVDRIFGGVGGAGGTGGVGGAGGNGGNGGAGYYGSPSYYGDGGYAGNGGNGGRGGAPGTGGTGGTGINFSGTSLTLTNNSQISGGTGGVGGIGGAGGVGGGGGVGGYSYYGASGDNGARGNGGNGRIGGGGGVGGAGINIGGTSMTLLNTNLITGGTGGAGGAGGSGGDGASSSYYSPGGVGGNGGNGNNGGAGGAGVINAGTNTTLTNSGTIQGGLGGSGGAGGAGGAGGVSNYGNPLNDSYGGNGGNGGGGGVGGAGLINIGTMTSLSNIGTIQGGAGGSFGLGGSAGVAGTGGGPGYAGTNGFSSASGGSGVVNNGSITSLVNSGSIRGGDGYFSGNGIFNNAGIVNLTNTGLIESGTSTNTLGLPPVVGINNLNGSIGTLNNRQSNLTFNGNLPTNYNIILDAATYGKLIVSSPSGSTTFGISSLSGTNIATAGTIYQNVLSGVSGAGITNENIVLNYVNGTLTATYELVPDDANVSNTWDLLILSMRSGPVILEAVNAVGNTVAVGAATVIDSNADLTAMFTGLPVGNAAISNAVTETLPLLTGGMKQAMNNTLHGLNRIIQSRQEGQHGRSSGDEFFGDKHAWFKPFGSWANQDDRSGVSGYDAKTYGMVLGADAEISDTNRLGLAFAYARSNVDSNASLAPQSANVDSYQLIAYGSHSINDTTDLNFQADFGQHNTDGKRNISFAGVTANSSYTSWSGHVGTGLSHTYALSEKTNLTPSIHADYTIVHDEGYTEKDAGILNLHVNGSTTEELILGLDGKLTHALTEKSTITANLGVGYDVINERASITAAFAGDPTASFVTNGLDPSPWLIRGGLGIVSKATETVEISARYDIEARKDFDNQTASVKVRWSF